MTPPLMEPGSPLSTAVAIKFPEAPDGCGVLGSRKRDSIAGRKLADGSHFGLTMGMTRWNWTSPTFHSQVAVVQERDGGSTKFGVLAGRAEAECRFIGSGCQCYPSAAHRFATANVNSANTISTTCTTRADRECSSVNPNL
jgi:hypothetical protein